MKAYLDFLRHIYENGRDKSDRTGVGTRSVFGYQMRFDLTKGFPIVTTKRVPFKLILGELLWFLRGRQDQPGANDDLRRLCGQKGQSPTIWEEWKKPDGSFGPIYGCMWRANPEYHDDGGGDGIEIFNRGPGIDQIANVIHTLRSNPDSRRMIVSAWNVEVVESGEMALPPCHVLFQFYTRELTFDERLAALRRRLWIAGQEVPANAWKDISKQALHQLMNSENAPTRALDCQLYQRSADGFLGTVFNISSYALLIHMIAQVVNMEPGEFIWSGGDCHLYKNHFEVVEEQLKRTPHQLPRLWINPLVSGIDTFTPSDFRLDGYVHDSALAADVAV